jgi:hypothetical protein
MDKRFSSDPDGASRGDVPMTAPSEIIQQRKQVWQALSELFLDTELQEYDFAYISRVLAESGHTDNELHCILFGEVFPACISNLRHPAGEWSGFNMDWLVEEILSKAVRTPANVLLPPPDYWMIEREWRRVLALLPEARRSRTA